MRRRASIITVLLVILTPLVSLAGGTPAAWALTCGSDLIRLAAYQWNDTNSAGNRDVRGVRAPIENRTDGALCDFSQFDHHSADLTWISIIGAGGSASALVQMGIIRKYYADGSHHECAFWELDAGAINPFQCDNLTNDTNYYFKIHTFMGKYLLAYCGTSGSYDSSNCTVKDGSHDEFNKPAGQIAVESHFSCDLHIFGNSTDQQNVGIPTSHIQGLDDTTQWTARTWTSVGTSDCPNFYIQSELNQGETMKFYDTRNSQ